MTPEMLTILGFTVLGYFIPSAIAFVRDHHNAAAIVALNLFLGWTFLGWVAALVWALTSVRPREYPEGVPRRRTESTSQQTRRNNVVVLSVLAILATFALLQFLDSDDTDRPVNASHRVDHEKEDLIVLPDAKMRDLGKTVIGEEKEDR